MVGDTAGGPPAGSRGTAPVGVWGRSLPEAEACVNINVQYSPTF